MLRIIDGGDTDNSPEPSGRTPALPLFLTEPLRGLLSLAALPLALPLLAQAPRGDGHTVIVLPGLMADDVSTLPLRRFLKFLGYDARGWRLGRNVGPTERVVNGLPRLLDEADGDKVSLIGWSLGGIFARELARAKPDSIRQVITLASPYGMKEAQQSRAAIAFRRHSRHHVAGGQEAREKLREPIPVPSSAVFSYTDGIVDWQACIEKSGADHENIRVHAGHLGIGVDPAVLWVIADRLAQAEGHWRTFESPGRFRAFFPQYP